MIAAADANGGRRWAAAVEVALVVALTAGDFYEIVPISSVPFLLLMGWISLRRRGLRWRDTGFTRPPSWPRAIAVGIVAGIGMELFSTFVTVPLLTQLTGKPPDLSDFRSTVGNVRMLLFWLALNWTLAAFGEELGYRGYVMPRVADLGGRTRAAWLASLVFTSALFGWGHGGQGITGMTQETLAGLMLGGLYLATGRNLTVPIVAHGVSNTLAFVLIYLGRYPGV